MEGGGPGPAPTVGAGPAGGGKGAEAGGAAAQDAGNSGELTSVHLTSSCYVFNKAEAEVSGSLSSGSFIYCEFLFDFDCVNLF